MLRHKQCIYRSYKLTAPVHKHPNPLPSGRLGAKECQIVNRILKAGFNYAKAERFDRNYAKNTDDVKLEGVFA